MDAAWGQKPGVLGKKSDLSTGYRGHELHLHSGGRAYQLKTHSFNWEIYAKAVAASREATHRRSRIFSKRLSCLDLAFRLGKTLRAAEVRLACRPPGPQNHSFWV